VIAIEVMKMIAVVGGIKIRSGRIIIAMRFVWIPGRSPVIVPAIIPRRRVMIIWSILFYLR